MGESSWSVEIETPLGKDEAAARLRANTEPWAGPLSKYVGRGGRYLYGDNADAKRFEGEFDGDRFTLQRIHYQRTSRGPRQWSEGEIVQAGEGSVVRVNYRLRAETYAFYAVWTLVLGALTGFGAYLGFGDRLPVFLAGAVGILLAGYAFLVIGVASERRICTELFREILRAA